MKQAIHSFISSYEDDMHHKLNLADSVNPKSLEQLHLSSVDKAKNKFDSLINNLRKPWIKLEPNYKSFFALAQQEAGKIFKQLVDENNRKIDSKCKNTMESILRLFDRKIKDFSTPDNEESLTGKISDLANNLIANFEENMKDYLSSPIVIAGTKELKKHFVDRFEEILAKNIKQIIALSKNVFSCAKKEVESLRCITCPSNWWPLNHKAEAKKAAEECFKHDPRASFFSPETKDRVIEDWYENDMAAERLSVFSNLLKVLVFLSIIGSAIGYLLYIYFKNRKDFTQPATAKVVLVSKRKAKEVKLTKIVDTTPAQEAEVISPSTISRK